MDYKFCARCKFRVLLNEPMCNICGHRKWVIGCEEEELKEQPAKTRGNRLARAGERARDLGALARQAWADLNSGSQQTEKQPAAAGDLGVVITEKDQPESQVDYCDRSLSSGWLLIKPHKNGYLSRSMPGYDRQMHQDLEDLIRWLHSR